VLLLAGAFEPVDDARAQQVKCDGVLVKPFEPQQVVSRVRGLVNGANSAKDRSTNVIAMPAPQPFAAPPQSFVAAPQPFAAAPQSFAAIHSEKPATPAASPAPPEAARKPESKLDDYFQGLDAALAVLDNKADGRAAASPEIDDFRASDVPTLEKLLGSTPLRDSGPADVPFAAAGISGSVLDGLTGHARTADPAPAARPGMAAMSSSMPSTRRWRWSRARLGHRCVRTRQPPAPRSSPMNWWTKSLAA
jgi:hypothetical protein